MEEPEVELWKRRAEAGDPHAQLLFAQVLDRRGEHAAAGELLLEAAESGHAPAQYVLGARLLVGRAAPYAPDEGVKWVGEAALKGQPEAQSLMAVLATVSGNWDRAIAFMGEAAKNGSQLAQQQLALLGSSKHFDAQAWDRPPAIDWNFQSPRVGVIKGFIPKVFCEWMIDRARPRLEGVRVNDPSFEGMRPADYRTNTGMGFSLIDSDLILQLIHSRIAAAIDLPVELQEPTNILHYAVGQEYKQHVDFFDPQVDNFASELEAGGQRTTTVLIYLNDDYKGGETDFPRLKWRFKGDAGDALVFWNVDENGEPDRKTLHAGLPPTRGEKWLLSKWIRSKPAPLL